ncbi:unnamed protein product [Ectocarpus sp. CCAP 1310/34]|nr:unnamed protein product [Ectocarpus sp. CCAP 1310/34]
MADAVFMNKEEVDLAPIYYDPVHDFGFYRFDPKAVKFMEVRHVSFRESIHRNRLFSLLEGGSNEYGERATARDFSDQHPRLPVRCWGSASGASGE